MGFVRKTAQNVPTGSPNEGVAWDSHCRSAFIAILPLIDGMRQWNVHVDANAR
ncbi:hypothetical protein SAMN02799630_03927 [Paenibacillus sp. UNCCL117]|nr:hypothetical protein SAMN04488602_1108 [Paenibacillus sp. cl123]SFW51617.1 hypothetical protein SAMN02799630_03927 [Paenibacillus sp. UNCCL117]